MFDPKRVAAIGGVLATIIGLGYGVAKALGIGFKPVLTFEAPLKCGACEHLMLKGTFKKGWKPLVGIPIAIYAKTDDYTAIINTISTVSNGSYNASLVLGLGAHASEYMEWPPLTLWAEANYQGNIFKSQEFAVIVFAEDCMGPCLSTLPPLMSAILQQQKP